MAMEAAANLNSLADEVPGVTCLTLPRKLVSGGVTTAPTSGTLYLTAIALWPGLVVNNLDFWQLTAATTPAHQWMCLVTPGGIVAAVTADNTGGQAVNTYYRAPVTVPYQVPPGSPGAYYIGIMVAAATTTAWAGNSIAFPVNPATFSGVSGSAAILAGGATGGTGLTTPAALGSTLTLTGVTGTTTNFYAATA